MHVLIDGRAIELNDGQHERALKQLDLPSNFVLVNATGLLQHDTGNGMVQILMPPRLFVAMFEDRSGRRRYGVITI